MKPPWNTSDAPEMEVSAPATSPPVQLSAVAMVNLAVFSASMACLAAAATACGICMSVLPGQLDAGAGQRDDALLTAGKPQSFAGGRLNSYARRRNLANPTDALADGGHVRADAGRFADDGDVKVDDAAAPGGDHFGSMSEEDRRVGTPPLRIAGRKVTADVAFPQRPVERISQGVQGDVGVGMPLQALMMRDADPAEGDEIARLERVHVEAGADAGFHLAVSVQQSLGAGKIVGQGKLQVAAATGRQRYLEAGPFGDRCVVG